MVSIIKNAVTKVSSLFPGRSQPAYEPVSSAGSDVEDGPLPVAVERIRSPRQRAAKRVLAIVLITLGFIVVIAWALVWEFHGREDYTLPCRQNRDDAINKGYQCHPDISQYWGQYSPYFTVPSKISADIPPKCQITFAQVLARHGARDPTYTKTILYLDLVKHIHSTVRTYEGKYEFLKTYDWWGGADKLTMFGVMQLADMGTKYYQRYQSLAKDTIPFVRATSQNRIRSSAGWWMQGFEGARRQDDAHTGPNYEGGYPGILISEEPGSNNTLSHNLCTAFESGAFSHVGLDAQAVFAATFIPSIQARVNEDLMGANLTSGEIIYLMDLCPFDTVAVEVDRKWNFAPPLSPFCHLFTTSEWRSYDYYQSLGKYYGFANGNPMGPTQGVGFVNELIARLTNSPVDDHTSTNSTLDDSQASFPTGKNATLFADFSHDNDMMAIFAALGLFNATEPLDKERLQSTDETAGYSSSWAVPFGARAYFEKMRCEGQDEELVRVLINDRVVPLQNCGADGLGRCKLGAYVESLEFARQGGHWDRCFE